MANVRKKQIRRFFTTQEGKSMIPTKILLSYRFKEYTGTAETPKVAVFAQVKNGGTGATKAPPVWINKDVVWNGTTYAAKNLGDTLFDSGTDGVNEALETSQVVYLNEEYDITGLIIEIFGREHLSRLREVIFFYKVDEFGEEQEYQLV